MKNDRLFPLSCKYIFDGFSKRNEHKTAWACINKLEHRCKQSKMRRETQEDKKRNRSKLPKRH